MADFVYCSKLSSANNVADLKIARADRDFRFIHTRLLFHGFGMTAGINITFG